MEKFLLFTTGGGGSDPLNWSSDEAALYSTSELKGMKPGSSRSIDLFFETTYGKEVVTLDIKNSRHSACMRSIATALNSNQAVITIADADSGQFCSPYINGVTITSQETYCQTITTNAKTKINTPRSNYSSCLIANTHTTLNGLKLYLTSQSSTDITSTTVLAAETEAASTSSVTLTVDTVSATADVFLDERVYVIKNDLSTTPGRVDFVGICTGVTDSTTLVFSGGLEAAITDNDILFTGTRYTVLNSIEIPAKVSLKLEADEISFDNSFYDLYVVSSEANGLLTFTFNY